MSCGSLAAATLTWDPSGTSPASGSAGSGTWDNSSLLWANGTSDVAYGATSVLTGNINNATQAGTTQIKVASTASLFVGQYVTGNGIPASDTISAIDTVNNLVTLTTAVTSAGGTNASYTFSNPSDVVFGGSGAAGTVTVSGTQSARSLTLGPATSGNYIFNAAGGGGSISLSGTSATTLVVNSGATFNLSVINSGAISFSSGQTVSFNGGGTIGSGFTGTGALTSSVLLSPTSAMTYAVAGGAPSYNAGNAGTIGSTSGLAGGLIINANAKLSSSVSFGVGVGGTGLVTVNGGELDNPAGYLIAGRSEGTTQVGRLVLNSGIISGANTLINFTGGSNLTTGGGEVDINGGTFTQTGIVAIGSNAAAGAALLSITGGTATIAKIDFGGDDGGFANSTGGTNTLNLTNGTLYVGAGGINNQGGVGAIPSINLSGGTVGAAAAWTSSMAMTLGTTNGNVTFQAANSGGTAQNIALSGNLTGSGGLNKTGGGSLTLSGTNAYAGTTTVTAGTLLLGSSGALGSGASFSAVTLNGGTIGFVGSLTVANTQALTLSANSFLDFSGGADSLTFADSSATAWTNGTILKIFNWTAGSDFLSFTSNTGLTAAQLNDIQFYSDGGATFLGTAAFTGANGNLMAATPEPGTWALLGAGLGLLLIRCRGRVAG